MLALLFGLGLLVFLTRNIDKDESVITISTRIWEPVVTIHAINAGIPVPVAMEWIQLESGGNVCAIGVPGDVGPDGNPREIGLFQVYNPDDLQSIGATGNELRTYCRGTRLTRPLTAPEMTRQIEVGIALIKKCRLNSGHYLVQAQWNPVGKDYWRMVKLWHALPGLVKALPLFFQKMQRAPLSWEEYRRVVTKFGWQYGDTSQASNVDQVKAANRAQRSWNNAEITGGVAPDTGTVNV